MEEWISLNEFMKRRKIGYSVALQMIGNNEVESMKTESGRYKIKVGGKTVSAEQFEAMKERAIKAETTIESMKNLLRMEI